MSDNKNLKSLGLKLPKQDALSRSERLASQNPGYESPSSKRLAAKLRSGDIPQNVPHFTDRKEYVTAVNKYLDNGGTTAGIKKDIGVLVGTGPDGNPTYQVMQSRGKLILRSNREKLNTDLNRELNTNLSNPDHQSRLTADAEMRRIGGGGVAADHDHSLTRVGNALDPMTEERRAALRSNFEEAGQRAGHYPENLKPLDSNTNRAKENGKLVTDDTGKHSGGYKRLDDNFLKPMEKASPSLTELQIERTGTTSPVGRQQGAMGIQRGLPGFPKPRNPFDYRVNGLGGVAGLMMDPEAAKKFAQGDYIGGLQTGAGSAAQGEVISRGLQWIAQGVGPKAGALMTGAGQVAGPVGAAYTGYQVANELVKAGTGEGFVQKVKNVQDKTRTKAINYQAQQTTQQLARKRKQTGQDQSVADKVGNAIDKTANDLQYLVKNPLSIFGIK